ncbi:precorrin-3B synthase [Methylocapsa sp. S129]|uniref:precorrin-3B synthase n=1 Tax=Methylocapsa sp. S129 TaxID=1641869 RepID=UPI00131E504E|nr:precorrin-3B synthase [Methylocapsa sp. S129]
MSAPASLRKGWCPGALVPMSAGDGLLVRIRVSGGRLDLDSVATIADCAARFGNGIIEISSRANLQLRGISETGLSGLQRRLDELGLLDADAAAENVRNIVASPLADIDPSAVLDTAPIVAALEARLGDDPSLHRLPAKFGFLIDGGGVLPLGDIEADIRFEALRSKGGPYFAATLAGAGDVAALCAPREVPDVAAALALAFLRGAGAGEDAPRRMRGLVALRGAASIFRAADLGSSTPPASLRRGAERRDFLGVQTFGASYCVGAAPSFGRMTTGDLRLLAQEARRCAAADVRLTPWRAFIVAGLDRGGAESLGAALGRRGFILDPADPRLAVVACSGAPACANAARAVQAEALELARSVPAARGIALHVSGCEKGCAHSWPAPFTLVARKGGYDLVVNGKASDEPAHKALSVEQIASLLAHEHGGDVSW